MKKRLLIFLFALVGTTIQAQIPNGYYNNANGKTGDELKTALHDIIKDHHVVSYNGLINAFAYTDCKPNGKIWDIYSNIEYSPSTGLCGEYEDEGDCWNREHTWPQSWFNESTTPRSDLFHVYPTDGFVNGQRSNYPYGEVNRPIYTSGNGSKLGPCVTSGYSGRVFEPIDEYKGDIARGYFYMSVRYYSEDSDWGTSGMTNKSEILPWAMNMLLRWSDEDPVSDKEIARNNAVYGYQNNRNPFIDHPEYAHMIWDENWQGGVYYNITCASSLSHGSVTAPETAMEGTTVSITATPEPGYMVDTYTVYKTGSPSTTVTVSSNGTFIMPGYAVTISATFVQNNNYYDITLGTVSHGTITASETSARSGMTITLTAIPNSGYSLYSWYVFKTGDMNTTVNVSGNRFVMPAFNVTVMATFVQGSANGDFVKVTSAPTDWSGEYILVYEQSTTTGYVWTGVDAVNSYVSKTISNNTIADDGVVFITIAPMSGGYSIKINGGTNNGKYIYGTSGSNKINFGTSPTLNTLSYESNSVKIVSNTSVMRFNNNSGQNRFRYFQSSTYTNQQPVQLYKRVHAAQTHSIHFNPNGGSGTMGDQTVNEFEPTALQDNIFTREGFVFEGWNTEADGTGDYYADGATVTLLDDLMLYAQWNQLFTITLVQANHGSISASASQAFEETEIVLSATPDPLFALNQWTVTDAQGNNITVTENSFEMPASDVTVSAVFSYSSQSFVQEYQLVTSVDQLIAGRTYLIVNVASGKALGTTQNNNNRSASDVTIEDGIIHSIGNTVCELTLGGSTGTWTLKDGNNGYLYAAGGGNYLRTQTNLTDKGKWQITMNNGTASIVSNGDVSQNTIKFNLNNGNPIFSCYASNSTQLDVCLFRRTEIYDYPAEQSFNLVQGWSWWSTFFDITLDDLQTALVAALPGSQITIKSKNNGSTIYYVSSNQWRGSLESLDVAQMYEIYVSAACTINLTGTPVDPSAYPITVHNGANWIGFPHSEGMALNDALGFTPTNGDILKSKNNGSTIYTNGRWRGDLTTLVPGQGYIYVSKARD
ncbi:MAG: endonuclease [Bacteroidales bacterium]|nr:endonuclease [Bacteroidales bacterium]